MKKWFFSVDQTVLKAFIDNKLAATYFRVKVSPFIAALALA